MLTDTWSPGRTEIATGSVHTLAPGARVTPGAPWNLARWSEPGASAADSGDGCSPIHTECTDTALSPKGLLSRIASRLPDAVTVTTLRTVASGEVPCTPSSADSVSVTSLDCGLCGAAGAAVPA